MKTVKLMDSASYGVGDFDIKKGETQVVHDDMLFMKLVDLGIFAEFPTTATYWVKSNQGRYIKYIDDAMQVIGPDPVRVTRRVFTQLSFHERKLQRVYPYELMQQEPERDYKIIITRDMGMGDVILSLDIVHNLKRFFPNCKISYATLPQHRCLLEGHPQIEAHHAIGEINPFDYDFDVYLPRKSETAPDAWSAVRTDIYLREALGDPLPEGVEHRTRLVLSVKEIKEARYLWCNESPDLDVDNDRWLVIQSKGSGSHRSLSDAMVEGLIDLALKDGWNVAVIGTEGHCHLPSRPGFANLCGKIKDVRQVAAVIANADLIICPDSGGYHMAAALDPPVPALVLFTTIPPQLRIRDYPLVKGLIGGPETLSCRPCSDRIICSGRLECVNQNDPQQIWNEAKGWFETCQATAS